MPESIAHRINAVASTQDAKELRQLLTAILADLTALRTSITGITAKLDLDAGVTDTNYAALNNPAALQLTV